VSVSTESGAAAQADAPEGSAGQPTASRPFPTGRVALAFLVGLVLGLVAGLLVPALTRPGDDSAEAGFVRDMSTHHAQAVEMGMIAYQKASDPEVRTLGGDIAATQQAQIGMMQSWLRGWKLDPTGSQPRMAWMPDAAGSVRDGLMPGVATDAEMATLRAATGKDVDVQFLTLMRQHHLGGIHMARGVLEMSDNDDVTWLAQTMVDGQQAEIAVIQSLLDKVRAGS
jgi:uncharacterized protein (DUF305 family)